MTATILEQIMNAVRRARTEVREECGPRRGHTPVGEAPGRWAGAFARTSSHVFIGGARRRPGNARALCQRLHQPPRRSSATHAWCQVWTGEPVGWIEVDPTHGGFIGDDYVTTAIGRDYSDVPPNRGLWKGRAEESISVTVKVEPVDRVPLEWNDWNAPTFRSMGQGGQSQFQRMGPNCRLANAASGTAARSIPTSGSRAGRSIISKGSSSNVRPGLGRAESLPCLLRMTSIPMPLPRPT